MGAGERAAVMGGNAMMLFGWATGEQG